MSIGASAEMFNIVINGQGRTQKCNFSVLDRKYHFSANLVEKIKIVNFSCNFVGRLIGRSRIQWRFSIFARKYSFWANLVPKFKTDYSKWNLIPRFDTYPFWYWDTAFIFLSIWNEVIQFHCVKGAVFGVFLVCFFPHSDWIRRDTP